MQALTAAGVPAVAAMKLAGFTQTQVLDAFPNGNTPAPAKMPVAPGKAVIGTAPQSAIRVG